MSVKVETFTSMRQFSRWLRDRADRKNALARTIDCPAEGCTARAGQPCPVPYTAICCPTCLAGPHVPCHVKGKPWAPIGYVHDMRKKSCNDVHPERELAAGDLLQKLDAVDFGETP